MVIENWNGHSIRYVEKNDEWWAFFDDACEALDIHPKIARLTVNVGMLDTYRDNEHNEDIINELGIYELIFNHHSAKANQFKRWSGTVMKKLRKNVGLKPFETLRMLDSDIQKDIDRILDTLYFDESTGKLMQSITVAGGDVEQVEFK